jgi:hypothetical protein
MKFLFNGWAHSVVLARHQVSGSFLLKNLRFLGYLLLKISFDRLTEGNSWRILCFEFSGPHSAFYLERGSEIIS